MPPRKFYVYLITNKNNTTFYIGVTNELERRVLEHKKGLIKGFSKKYNLHKLVYYEEFTNSYNAILREKQLKNWHREWKLNLVRKNNPHFQDLSEEWFEIPKQVRDDDK